MTSTPHAAREALPEILISDRQLDAVIDDAIDALMKANEPPELYMRGGHVVSVGEDEEGRALIRNVPSETLVERLSGAAQWYRKGKRGDFKEAGPTRGIALTTLQRFERLPRLLPPVRGIVESPVMRPDGTILETPGYDPATRLVYVPAHHLAMPPIPETPTSTDCEEAVALAEEMMADFPFVSDADRATAWALLLTVPLRELIAGSVPLTVFTAPSQGTGKGLLVDAASIVTTGQRAAISSMPDARGDDEMRKRITTILLAGHPVSVIDNVMRPIDSASLAAALTADRWMDRALGVNAEVNLPNRVVWVATGNNVAVRGDFARRTVWCRLDARVARPWLREGFRHPDLLAWVAEHRGELLAALLTLARAWVVTGRPGPADGMPPLGGYESWRHVVGGVLRMAGVGDLLGQAAEMYDEADEETPVWAAFLGAWHGRWGEGAVSVAELVKALRSESESTTPSALVEAVPPELAAALDAKSRAGVRIGHALRKHAGKRFPLEDGAVWLTKSSTDAHAKAVRWAVRCG